MENLLIYLIKSSTLLLFFFTTYYFLLKKETFFTANRWFLIAGIFCSAFLPLISFQKIVWVEPAVSTLQLVNSATTSTSVTNAVNLEENTFSWELLLIILYSLGVLIFLSKLIIEFYSLKKIIKTNNKKHADGCEFIEVNQLISPFSFFNKIVYNPTLFQAEELENIIEHEKIHAKQWHSLDVLMARMHCIIFWWNPLVWFYKKAMIQNLEFIADQNALAKVVDKKSYLLTLLKITTAENPVAITNHFYQSLIKKRIVMLNKNQSKKRNSWKYLSVVPVLIAFVLLFQIKVIAQEKKSDEIELKFVKIDKSSIIIDKNTTDNEMTSFREKLKKLYNIDLSFYNITRNPKREIIKIESKSSDQSVSVSYFDTKNNPIRPFKFYFDDVKKEMGYTVDVLSLSENKESYINGNKATKKEPSQKLKVIKIKDQQPKPLIIINGKKQTADFDLKSIDPNTIAAINVLKDEKAIEKYGKEAMNGVIEVTTKDKNFELTTPTTTSKSSKSFSSTQLKFSTDSLGGKGNFKPKADVRDLNLEKIDPTNLNNKQYSKKKSKIQYVKVNLGKATMDEAEIYIDGAKSTKAALDKIKPSSIDKMDVIKSDE